MRGVSLLALLFGLVLTSYSLPAVSISLDDSTETVKQAQKQDLDQNEQLLRSLRVDRQLASGTYPNRLLTAAGTYGGAARRSAAAYGNHRLLADVPAYGGRRSLAQQVIEGAVDLLVKHIMEGASTVAQHMTKSTDYTAVSHSEDGDPSSSIARLVHRVLRSVSSAGGDTDLDDSDNEASGTDDVADKQAAIRNALRTLMATSSSSADAAAPRSLATGVYGTAHRSLAAGTYGPVTHRSLAAGTYGPAAHRSLAAGTYGPAAHRSLAEGTYGPAAHHRSLFDHAGSHEQVVSHLMDDLGMSSEAAVAEASRLYAGALAQALSHVMSTPGPAARALLELLEEGGERRSVAATYGGAARRSLVAGTYGGPAHRLLATGTYGGAAHRLLATGSAAYGGATRRSAIEERLLQGVYPGSSRRSLAEESAAGTYPGSRRALSGVSSQALRNLLFTLLGDMEDAGAGAAAAAMGEKLQAEVSELLVKSTQALTRKLTSSGFDHEQQLAAGAEAAAGQQQQQRKAGRILSSEALSTRKVVPVQAVLAAEEAGSRQAA